MPWQSKGLLIPFHPIPKTEKSFSGEDARTRSRTRDHKPMVIVVLYTDLTFQLPPTLTIKAPRLGFVVRPSIGYEICGLAAKDHSKINEGEVKGHQLVLLM